MDMQQIKNAYNQAKDVGIENFVLNQVGGDTSNQALKFINLVKARDEKGLEAMGREILKGKGIDADLMFNMIKNFK